MQESCKEKKREKAKVGFTVEKVSAHRIKFCIFIPACDVRAVYKQTLKLYQDKMRFIGFKNQKAPVEYLEKNYKKPIEESVKNFIFKHIVLNFLIKNIRKEKINLVNYPRLTNVKAFSNKALEFYFDVSIADPIRLKEWKYLIFRAPKRKLYKDLDKQVALFIKQEHSLFKKRRVCEVEEGDWVLFDAKLVNDGKKEVFDNGHGTFWIKAGCKYVSIPFQSLLVGKRNHDSFYSDLLPIKNDFSHEFEKNRFSFLITIKDIVKGYNFSLDSFKYHFRLKSKADVHSKLVEVFSYRNDISQRKSIVEEVFHLLLSKHRFEVPKHFVVRRQEDILNTLRKHPDYQVYKLQKDFFEQIEVLAEKLLKEEILVDQIAYNENINLDYKDVKSYLYLFNNNRLKEFVYFKPALFNIDDSDSPLQEGVVEQSVLREKTLNYIIHELTK